MPRIDALPCPPSRDPRPRSERIPDSVLSRYEALLDHVRARRKELGLSQEELSKRAGISKAQFANIERGYSLLSVPKLLVLADTLDTTVCALLERRRWTRSSGAARRRD
jgi:DNA-binding XRE family transcriptional regulator